VGVDRGIVQARSHCPPSSRHVRWAICVQPEPRRPRMSMDDNIAPRRPLQQSKRMCRCSTARTVPTHTRMICAEGTPRYPDSTLLDSLELELVDKVEPPRFNLICARNVWRAISCRALAYQVGRPSMGHSALALRRHPRVLNFRSIQPGNGELKAVTGRDQLSGGMIGVPHLPWRKRGRSNVRSVSEAPRRRHAGAHKAPDIRCRHEQAARCKGKQMQTRRDHDGKGTTLPDHITALCHCASV
jgi:hypothetical protein